MRRAAHVREHPDHEQSRRAEQDPGDDLHSAAEIARTAMDNTLSMASSGQTQRRYAAYGTRAIARPPITTADVGTTRLMTPQAVWYEVTTSAADTPRKPASGTMIGIASVASPAVDGITNGSGRKSRNMMIRATPSRSPAPATKLDVSSPSPIRPTIPIMIANRRNDAVISGNHHHHVGNGMPMSSHGTTP